MKINVSRSPPDMSRRVLAPMRLMASPDPGCMLNLSSHHRLFNPVSGGQNQAPGSPLLLGR